MLFTMPAPFEYMFSTVSLNPSDPIPSACANFWCCVYSSLLLSPRAFPEMPSLSATSPKRAILMDSLSASSASLEKTSYSLSNTPFMRFHHPSMFAPRPSSLLFHPRPIFDASFCPFSSASVSSPPNSRTPSSSPCAVFPTASLTLLSVSATSVLSKFTLFSTSLVMFMASSGICILIPGMWPSMSIRTCPAAVAPSSASCTLASASAVSSACLMICSRTWLASSSITN